MGTEIIIRATRTQNVLGEKERRIRVLTSVVQKRFKFPENTYICSPLLGHGPSMLPTLNLTGDWILSEKVLNLSGKVHNGDIVTARSPENPKKFVVKRIMGMEGDTVTYIVDPKNSEKCRTITVPKGHVWIQEDNIYSSNDSRRFGSIPYGLIEDLASSWIWITGTRTLVSI
ncbi:mitochondrial inner membrane protease subunit 1-like isoform X2 [Papaver somniferum]|uniref:mitochondrial inner membrane protease subunit 1-like isoform X2 n=1 Tax=Papaver somniferum TaxID=3469 RepID=UPI000E6FCAB8|nr:mitochondrial inner membrane protease subunit 1-like isoform X2 [Papaver somniferum]